MKRKRRDLPLPPLPQRLKSLFHQPSSIVKDKVAVNKFKLEVLHNNPTIYLIRDFLTKKDLEYFDNICTKYSDQFDTSFTEGHSKKTIISNQRTSRFIYLNKGQDRLVRGLEERAANLVGLHTLNVEPLQILSYSKLQKFEAHHDGGTYSTYNNKNYIY